MFDGSGCPFEQFLRQLGLRRGKKGENMHEAGRMEMRVAFS